MEFLHGEMRKVWQIEKKFRSGEVVVLYSFSFMSYFYNVNNDKLKISSKIVLEHMLLKNEVFVLVPALFGIEIKVALVHC